MTVAWTLYPAAQLAQFAARWDSLNAEAGNLPFLETRFLLPLLANFGTGRERLAFAMEGDQCVAAALVEPLGRSRWQTVQPSQLPLGTWIARDEKRSVELVQSLMRRLPGFALNLGLTQLDPRFTHRPPADPQTTTLDYIETAWVDVAGDFDTFWNARGKNLRSNARKQRTKLDADGIAQQLDILRAPEDVADALIEYGRLETASWKAGTGTAVAPDNAQGRFYREMMEAFCQDGRGEIWRYRFNDSIVAMDLCVAAGRTLVILKTAFDSSHKSISPATLLHQDAFRHVFESGAYDRIEFYGRVMEWHTRWTEQKRSLFHLTSYRWPLINSMLTLARRAKQSDPQTTSEDPVRVQES